MQVNPVVRRTVRANGRLLLASEDDRRCRPRRWLVLFADHIEARVEGRALSADFQLPSRVKIKEPESARLGIVLSYSSTRPEISRQQPYRALVTRFAMPRLAPGGCSISLD